MLDVGTHCTVILGNIVISNRTIYITEGTPLRRFKGSKKEFRGLEVALISYFVCVHNILETGMIKDTLII